LKRRISFTALDLLTATIIEFTRREGGRGRPAGRADHFYYSVPRGIRVVDDVAVNLSAGV
jgi:hypothetical protein